MRRRIEHLEVLVEERSMELALLELLPKMIGSTSFEIRPFDGKRNLLRRLESRLRGYATYIRGTQTAIVVLVDEDRQDCHELKKQLEDAARRAGLDTMSGQRPLVLNRIVVEELEAWFFGDPAAIAKAYSGVPKSLSSQQRYRRPDAIKGGTWEALEALLQRHGHHRTGLAKTISAREIARHMDPARNISPSFKVFHSGIRRLIASEEND